MRFPGARLPNKTVQQRAERDAAYAAWITQERERIRRQRLYLTTLKGPVRDAMVKRMLDRAWIML